MTHAMPRPESRFDVAAMLANCRQYWLNFSLAIPSDGPFSIYRTGVPHPLLNGVIQLREPAPDGITAVVSQLDSMPSLWWIGPDSYPRAVQDLVKAGGRVVSRMPVMAARLRDLAPDVTIPARCTIEPLDDARDLPSWVECYSEPMGVAEADFEAMLDAERGRSDAPGQLTRFAARIDGDIVGTAELFVHAGLAGIYLVATTASHRRLGIATALVHAACMAGLERGLDVATLQASSSGHPVYKKMGFDDVAAYDLLQFPKGET